MAEIPSSDVSAKRRNTGKSTGPRTAIGKSRSSKNAWKHGLSLGLRDDVQSSVELEALVSELAGPSPDPARLFIAKMAGQAELMLRNVYSVRASLIEQALQPSLEPKVADRLWRRLERLGRYEHWALSVRKRAFQLI
jgi:hypothetical protein